MNPYPSKDELKVTHLIEQFDNPDGYRWWLASDDKACEDFECYVNDNFANVLANQFINLLHPEQRKSALEDISEFWSLWSMFLWVVLDEERLNVLLTAFVESDRDRFEQWILN